MSYTQHLRLTTSFGNRNDGDVNTATQRGHITVSEAGALDLNIPSLQVRKQAEKGRGGLDFHPKLISPQRLLLDFGPEQILPLKRYKKKVNMRGCVT